MSTALKYAEGDYTYWQRTLAGEKLPMHDGDPHAGFYRMRRKGTSDDAVSYFWHGAEMICLVNGQKKDPNSIWTFCGHNPVSHHDYLYRIEGGGWPNDAEIVAKSNRAPDDNSMEAVLARLDDLEREAKLLISAGAAKDQNAADRASDIANTIGEIEKKVIELHKVEKQPHLNAGRAVDSKWFPVRDRAGSVKQALKTVVVTPFLIELQRAADAEAEKAAELGVEEFLEQPKIGAGSIKRTTALRTKVSAKIVQYEILLDVIKTNPEVRDLAQKIADRAVRATGVALPGTVKVETETAA